MLALGLLASTSSNVKLDNVLFLVGTGVVGFGISFVWPQHEPISPRLARFGLLALVLVIVQGVLGGLRVTALADWLGIFHGTLAQCFLALMCAIAMVTSSWWQGLKAESQPMTVPAPVRNFLLVTTLLILGQLALGASMRHQHAGLAVSDFRWRTARAGPRRTLPHSSLTTVSGTTTASSKPSLRAKSTCTWRIASARWWCSATCWAAC